MIKKIIDKLLIDNCPAHQFFESCATAQWDADAHRADRIVGRLEWRKSLVLEAFHNFRGPLVAESEDICAGRGLLHSKGIVKGVCRGSLIGPDESGNAELDASEISDHDDQYIAQIAREQLPVDGLARRRRRLSVIVRTPAAAVRAEPPGIAVMPCVEVLFAQ